MLQKAIDLFLIKLMENIGASPLEVANPSNKTSLESPDLSLEILNKIQHTSKRPSLSPSPSPSKRPSLFISPSERQIAKIKHSLTRSLSFDQKKVTRSKVMDNFEHTELTFERKPHVKKMVTIKLEEAFKLIPLCTGEDDMYPFINLCDMVVNLLEEKFAPTLVKYITTRLSGRALEMIKYKNVTKWDVNDYCHRVEKLYYILCTACTLNKKDADARVIHETLKEQTLVIFIKGLIGPIRTIVKARNPKTLEVAKQLAKAEVEYKSDRDINYRYMNDFSNNRDNYNVSRQNNNNLKRTNNTRNNNTNNHIRISLGHTFRSIERLVIDCQKSTFENNIYIVLLNLKQFYEENKLDKIAMSKLVSKNVEYIEEEKIIRYTKTIS
ncbi:myb-like protein D [Aphis craccivora]|uniref:Myb-like protein D n=1 Tax=Aphis craccivora TaxID=307492 RepID=A0A6G0YF64_APHCR|nr:myb-like protein D [Aphis craccivora]